MGWGDVTAAKRERNGTAALASSAGSTRRIAFLSNLCLGQAVSVFISGSGIAAASLSDRGMNYPLFMSFIGYACLCIYGLRIKLPLKLPAWQYALYAFMDVEANFLVVLRCVTDTRKYFLWRLSGCTGCCCQCSLNLHWPSFLLWMLSVTCARFHSCAPRP